MTTKTSLACNIDDGDTLATALAERARSAVPLQMMASHVASLMHAFWQLVKSKRCPTTYSRACAPEAARKRVRAARGGRLHSLTNAPLNHPTCFKAMVVSAAPNGPKLWPSLNHLGIGSVVEVSNSPLQKPIPDDMDPINLLFRDRPNRDLAPLGA